MWTHSTRLCCASVRWEREQLASPCTTAPSSAGGSSSPRTAPIRGCARARESRESSNTSSSGSSRISNASAHEARLSSGSAPRGARVAAACGKARSMVWSAGTLGPRAAGLPVACVRTSKTRARARSEPCGSSPCRRISTQAPARRSARRTAGRARRDAAHNVHPLAGQGVDLGLRDARELAAVLEARGRSDCGDYGLLRRYERARKEDIAGARAHDRGLEKLFSPRGSGWPGCESRARARERPASAEKPFIRRAAA